MSARKPKTNKRKTGKIAEADQTSPVTPNGEGKQSVNPKEGIGGENETEDDLNECVRPAENENSKKNSNEEPKLKRGGGDAKFKRPREEKPQTISKFSWAIVSLVLVITVAVVFRFVAPEHSNYLSTDFQSNMDKLFKDFKNQPARTGQKLRSRIVPYLNHTTSPQPFVLLVAAMQEDRLAAHCFANKVGQLILPNTEAVVITGSSYSDVESKEAKKDIDQQLRKAFQKGEFPTAAIIHDLESIPYSASELFYSYCDHDNPLYKEAAIIFTVVLPESYSLASLSDDIKKEEMVETYLSRDSQWARDANFDENVMGALLSRITDTVIVLNSENNETLETCQ